MDEGRVGVWSSAPALLPADEVRSGVGQIEGLGYASLWYPEGNGREAFSLGAMLLGWSSRLVIGAGIASIYARDAWSSATGADGLLEAYPGRYILGLGVSHRPLVERRGHDYGPAVATMASYLDAMDATRSEQAPPKQKPRRVLAALGPAMLRLAGTKTDGAHPYFVPVEHTVRAREILGANSLLVPEVTVLVECDAAIARATAREFAARYLAMENYRNSLLRLGFDQADLSDGGSDRLIDSVVAWGDPGQVAACVQAHLDAGADQVLVQPLPSGQFCLDQLQALAPLLLDGRGTG